MATVPSPFAGIIDIEESRHPVLCTVEGVTKLHNKGRRADEVQVRFACDQAVNEGPTKGRHFFKKSCLRVLRVGSGGVGTVQEESRTRTGGESADHKDEGKDGGGQEGDVHPRSFTEGKGGLHPHDAAIPARGCKELSGHSSGAGRAEASGGHGESTGTTPAAGGAIAQPAHLANCTGRGEQSGGSDERSFQEPGSDEAGSRTKAGSDEAGSQKMMTGAQTEGQMPK